MSSLDYEATLQEAAAYLADIDETLAPIIAAAGLPHIVPHKFYYQELVESIISQQLSVKAAASILKKFLALFHSNDFPTPEQILEKSVDELRSAGLSRPKIGYIQDLAQKVQSGTVRFNHLDVLDNDAIIAELTAIKGVGVWTVHMFLIFCMGRLDVLPVGDLGIRNGFKKLYGFSELPSPDEMQALAEKNQWHPYESVASWYIWHSLDNKPSV